MAQRRNAKGQFVGQSAKPKKVQKYLPTPSGGTHMAGPGRRASQWG